MLHDDGAGRNAFHHERLVVCAMSTARLVDMNKDRNVFFAFVCLHDTLKGSRPARSVHLIVDHDTRIVVDERLALHEAQFVHEVHLVLVYDRLECCNVVLQHVFPCK